MIRAFLGEHHFIIKKNEMKKINTLFVSLLFASTVILSNQLKAQSCSWAYKAGSIYEDNGTSVATDASGNVYYLGNFYSQSIVFGTTTLHNLQFSSFNKGSDIFLVKYDSCGNFIWAKQAGGDNTAYGSSVVTDATGNIYIGGYFSCDTLYLGAVNLVNVGSSTNAFVAKYNSSGVAQWATGGSGDAQNYINAIALDASNNVYATGYFASNTLTFGSNSLNNGNAISGGNSYDMFVAKFNNSGVNQWVNGSTSNSQTLGDVIGYGIGTDATGNVYVGGTFGSNYIQLGTDSLPNAGYNDIFVAQYSSSGALQWYQAAGGTDDDEAFGLATDAAGNSYITGYVFSSSASFGAQTITNTGTSTSVIYLAKYNNAGTALWARGTQGDAYTQNQGFNVALDALGNPNVIGFFNSDSLVFGPVTVYNNSNTSAGGADSDSMDIFVAKYRANGNLLWVRTAGGTGNDYGYGITTGTHNNRLYICGEFDSPTISFPGTTFSITAGSVGGAGDAFIVSNISTSPVTPSICMVTTDSLSINNIVFWDNTYPAAAGYIIYRRDTASMYLPIGMVSKDSLSQLIDTARHVHSTTGANGDPNVASQWYKLQIIDTAGTYSQLSPYHSTIHITEGSGGTFSWATNYEIEGAASSPVSSYVLFCDTANTNVWTDVAAAAGASQSITDPGFIHHSSIANWRVDALGFNCTPTTARLPANNSIDAAKVKSHSNTNNNRVAGINKITGINQQVSVYPNPSNGSFVVETNATEKQNVQIFDVTGKLVLTQSLTGRTAIDGRSLNEGVYNISIIGSEGIVNKRMVIVR
jgi:hypothetical protein